MLASPFGIIAKDLSEKATLDNELFRWVKRIENG
jgi:hypothetical protein